MGQLALLVREMSDDLELASSWGRMPFTGQQLRQHYREMVRRDGAIAAVVDARARYAAQVRCELLPLNVTDGKSVVLSV